MTQFDLRIFFKWVGEKPPTTWMSQEVSKGLGSVGYNPNIPHL